MKYALFIGLLFMLSCDCYQVVSGSVIDDSTQQPIEGVVIRNKNKEYDKVATDSTGLFELSTISGGLCGCPSMEIVIEGKGYLPLETKIRAGGNKRIELTK